LITEDILEHTLVLHGMALSGHSHRVELMLNFLNLPYRRVDSPAAVRATPEFRKLNPYGQIPVLEDGALVLADSNAILVYLAKRYGAGEGWLPEDPAGAAAVQRWLSVAAGEIAYGPALARLRRRFVDAAADVQPQAEVAARILPFMDSHLASTPYLAGSRATLADVACYAYVARAPEGGVDLAPYPHLTAWLARVEALPRFIPMPQE
jgi:glutathione S-transferase